MTPRRRRERGGARNRGPWAAFGGEETALPEGLPAALPTAFGSDLGKVTNTGCFKPPRW